jgi:hypothetical protein
MARARFAGLWLVGLLALGSLGASAAPAEPPDFGRCLKLAGGKFKDGGCKKAAVPGEERYEWYPAFSGEKPIVKTGFTLSSKEGTLLQFGGTGEKIVCKSMSGSGSYTGAKSASVPTVVLTGCESGELPCTTGGRAAGEIVLDPLVGTLGVVKKGTEPAKTKAGLDLNPTSGEEVAQFSCGLIPVSWRGSLIIPVTANAMKLSTTWKLVYLNGKQKPESFEGGERDVLEGSTAGGPYEQVGVTLTLVETNEEKIEVSTVN